MALIQMIWQELRGNGEPDWVDKVAELIKSINETIQRVKMDMALAYMEYDQMMAAGEMEDYLNNVDEVVDIIDAHHLEQVNALDDRIAGAGGEMDYRNQFAGLSRRRNNPDDK